MKKTILFMTIAFATLFNCSNDDDSGTDQINEEMLAAVKGEELFAGSVGLPIPNSTLEQPNPLNLIAYIINENFEQETISVEFKIESTNPNDTFFYSSQMDIEIQSGEFVPAGSLFEQETGTLENFNPYFYAIDSGERWFTIHLKNSLGTELELTKKVIIN